MSNRFSFICLYLSLSPSITLTLPDANLFNLHVPGATALFATVPTRLKPQRRWPKVLSTATALRLPTQSPLPLPRPKQGQVLLLLPHQLDPTHNPTGLLLQAQLVWPARPVRPRRLEHIRGLRKRSLSLLLLDWLVD